MCGDKKQTKQKEKSKWNYQREGVFMNNVLYNSTKQFLLKAVRNKTLILCLWLQCFYRVFTAGLSLPNHDS